MSQKFLTFAETECQGSSPLYNYLSIEISKDEELLNLCMQARESQPLPNLLFGAVHYLLLKGTDHQLNDYYPSIVTNPKPYDQSFDSFQAFCRSYSQGILSILKTRRVQTNDVRRCAYLYPVFCFIYKKAKKNLALIEIGTSAGLQLLWDKYAYSYGQHDVLGNKESRLEIPSEIVGDHRPILCSTPPPVSTRVGLDLNVVDLTNADEKLWLKSLIWPEHKERRLMFEKASSYISDYPVHFVEGNGVELLYQQVENVPEDSVACIFHTHVANQMTPDMKRNLLKTVESMGKERDVCHIYNNIQDRYLHLDYYLNGVESKQTIAEIDGHGRWFKWLIDHD